MLNGYPVGCVLYLRGKKRQENKGTGKPRKRMKQQLFELCVLFFCFVFFIAIKLH